MSTPNRDIPYVPENTLDPAAGLNEALDVIDAEIVPRVIRMDLTAPPMSPSDGDLYIPASPATGAWAGLENHLVRYRSEGSFWQDYEPAKVSVLLNDDDLGLYKWDTGVSPAQWNLAAGLGDAPSDGDLYARKDGLWEAIPGGGGAGIVIQDLNSPPDEVDPANTIIFGDGFVVTDLGGGDGLVEFPGGGGGGGFENVTPDRHPEFPDAMDDEFEDGSLDAKWTPQNSPLSIGLANGSVLILSTATGSDNPGAIDQPTPGGTWRIRIKGTCATARFDNRGGMIVRRGTNLYTFGLFYSSGWTHYVNRQTSFAAGGVSSLYVESGAPTAPFSFGRPWEYQEIEYDGTDVIFRCSQSGIDGTFIEVAREAAASHLGGAPTNVGIYADRGTSNVAPFVCDWFRRQS